MSVLRRKLEAFRTGMAEPLPVLKGSFVEKAITLFDAVVTADIDFDALSDGTALSVITEKAKAYEHSRLNPVKMKRGRK